MFVGIKSKIRIRYSTVDYEELIEARKENGSRDALSGSTPPPPPPSPPPSPPRFCHHHLLRDSILAARQGLGSR
jgi:hypothetical protein